MVIYFFYFLKQHLNAPVELKAESEVKTIEECKKIIENARLHYVSYDLQMDYLLTDNTNSDNFDVINNLQIANDAIENAIIKYGELLEAQTDAKNLYAAYQRTYNGDKSLSALLKFRQATGTGIFNFFARTDKLAEVYGYFITFALNNIQKLSEIIYDPNISWEIVHVGHRIELIQKFNDRLISCVDLLEECNKLQPSTTNSLNEMMTIFNELKDVSMFEFFLNRMKELLENRRKELRKEDFRFKIDLLLNKLKQIPGKGLDIYNKRQEFAEMRNSNSLAKIISRWKDKAYTGELEGNYINMVSFTLPTEQESKKRKLMVASVSNITLNYIIQFRK